MGVCAAKDIAFQNTLEDVQKTLLLKQQEYRLRFKNADKEKIFLDEIEKKNKSNAIWLIQNNLCNLNFVDVKGRTPLILASENYMYDIIIEILKVEMAKPNSIDIKKLHAYHITPLMWLCTDNISDDADIFDSRCEAIKLLLQLNSRYENNFAKISKSDGNKKTALMFACKTTCDYRYSNRWQDIIIQILQSGHSDPFHIDNDGKMAYDYAVAKNFDKVTKYMLEHDLSNIATKSDNEPIKSCPICLLEQQTKYYLFQCGHHACISCASLLDKCHICRAIITTMTPLKINKQ